MSEVLTVRPLESRDVPAVMTLRRDALGDGAPDGKPWNEPAWAIARKRNARDGLLFVGEADDAVVATVAGGYDGVRGWVYGLAVAESHRGLGFGRAMLDHLEAELRHRGCEKINLQVRADNPAAAFYEACGYEDDAVQSYGKPLAVDREKPRDPVPDIRVDGSLVLTQIRRSDRDAYVEHFTADAVYNDMMGTVPHPYLAADADQFIQQCLGETFPMSQRRSWALRPEVEGPVIGGVSLFDTTPNERGEIGYWLAKERWGGGIMARVVSAVCDFAFESFGLQKIEGKAYSTNPASQRTLQNAGFEREGVLRSHAFRNGEARDMIFYGRLAANG